MRKLASWLAILAMALQALWPLLAQAKPATLVPVCTVGGVTHYVEVPGAPAPADSQHEHCSFCFAGAALPASRVPHAVEAISFRSPKAVSFTPRSFIVVGADARAPPVLSVVTHFNNDNGRTHEKAFAISAADPHRGGSVVRLGVLHG
jgi:hypothetical protein